jgi:hypothetical protein
LEIYGYFEIFNIIGFTKIYGIKALALGANAIQSEFFCLWCDISKDEIGNVNAFATNRVDWKAFEKQKLLDLFLPPDVILDLLHIMLRVTDNVSLAHMIRNFF